MIRHDVSEASEDRGDVKGHKEIKDEGFVSKKCFEVIMDFNTDKNGFSKGET